VDPIQRLLSLLKRSRSIATGAAPQSPEDQAIDAEALSSLVSEAAEQAVLKALGPMNEQDPSRPNMSPLAESLRDYKLLTKNIKVLSWKLSQIESNTFLDENPDWRIRRTAREVVERFADQFHVSSRPCCGSDIYSGWHFGLSWLLGGNPLTRKVWEWTFTVQALWNLGILRQDNPALGIGFGCGTEPLISLLANFNVELLATDLTGESEVAKSWAESGQNTGNLENLFMPRLVDRSDFSARVRYRDMDMTDIPLGELEGRYDFAWSSCALEHLGSKKNGLDFIINSTRCLKPGGIGIHTTEFDHTGKSQIDNWPTVLFTQEDILNLQRQLDSEGMELLEPSFQQSGHFIDGYIDIPPYPHNKNFDSSFFQADGAPHPSSMPQLNLSIDGFKATSYALIVRRR
jgi:hypothetical protein